MRATQFRVNAGVPVEGTNMQTSAQFVCPKCGGDDVSIMFLASLDRLLIVCRRCAYQQTRSPLDQEVNYAEE